MKKFLSFCTALTVLFIIFGCGEGSSESPKTDGDQTEISDSDGDTDVSDIETPDEDSDTGDTAEPDDTDTDEPGKKQGELYGRCYPNKTCNEGLVCDEENDTCIKDPGNTGEPDKDSDDIDDNDVEISDEDNDITETPDTDTPVNPEAAESHKISGAVQAGSATAVALYECGKTEEIASTDADDEGKFSFNAEITASKTYCVKSEGLASCFKGMSDHVANISEITTAAYLLDKTCADLRKSETKIRTYAKLGTGEWLGELDYLQLSGISEGLKLLSSLTGSTDAKEFSEKIAEDAKKETPEFAKLFNGFKVLSDKTEIIIGESVSENGEAVFAVEGGSAKVAPNFKIAWTLKNKSAEAATYKFTTLTPGEYVARAQLFSGNDTLSQDSATVLFLQRKSGGTVYVNDTTKNISFRIDDGIYGVIPKGTVVKKNGKKINSISYDVLSAGGSQVSRLDFRPDGATFEGDSMYFIHELGTVYGGDPKVLTATRTNSDGSVDVMQSAAGDPIMMAAAGDPIMTTAAGDPIMTAAAGDPIMTSAAGDPIMSSAAGDPIMSAAAGDPIMTSAAGDPIMASAAGDPIMMGTSSSTMVSQTNHYSTFTVEAAYLPVSLDDLKSKWCAPSYYKGYSPLVFIRKGVEKYKPEGDDKDELLSYLDSSCTKFTELGNDLYELVNRQIGFQRNLNLIENLYYISELYNRYLSKSESGEFAAVRNGLELRSAIASLYTSTTSYNRSATLADMFDSSMIPLTYSGNVPDGYSTLARNALTGTAANDNYVATKKELMIFANYITTSSKGPDFSNVSSILTPDQLVCAWLDPQTEPQNCSKVYTLNEAGHVVLGGTEVSAAEANAVFTKYFMPMNSRLSESEKLDLFRTFYLVLKYAGTVFYNGSEVEELNEKLLETAYLVFDGINRNRNAVSIVDSFDASAHTVQVLEGNSMETKPYLANLIALTDKISLKVSSNEANVEKVIINIEGYEFDKVQENTRVYYQPKGVLKEKSIVLTPGTLSNGLNPLKDLLGSENVDEPGSITGEMTIVVNSKISGKTYTDKKVYGFLVNSDSDGVESRPVPANLSVFLADADGSQLPAESNPGIILNPGNRVLYPESDGSINIENLAPASYTIDAFADGYYAKNVGVNLTPKAAIHVEIRLDAELTGTADANLELNININTAKHPSKVYVQIYNEYMDLVANETAVFNGTANKYETINIEMNSGRYTLLAVGKEMYDYLEAITVEGGSSTKTITVVAKNACGNGIVDSAEECETGDSADSTGVRCGDIYPASIHPEKTASCNPDTCVYDKHECGKAAFCGDGVIDAGEGCDGGAKECSEITGFENASGSAPCAANCSDWITAGNCSRTTETCGSLPDNAVWNDGSGRFVQVYDGTDWVPGTKAASYGLTKEECVFSCAKGYIWDAAHNICAEKALSLGKICTGQTSCFDSSAATECPAYGEALFGQDAQYAQAGFCTNRKLEITGSGDELIATEKYTHFVWQGVSSESYQTWANADKYCMNSTYGGATDWRLPTPVELLTIVDLSRNNPAVDENFAVSGNYFWATEDKKQSGNAWKVSGLGIIQSVAKTKKNFVICIREYNKETNSNRFESHGETVTDNDSSLMWQMHPVASRTWSEALSYCEDISTDDKFDWRLPNRNELASLVNYTKKSGVSSDFPGMADKIFWTSTSAFDETDKAWTVDFNTGTIDKAAKSDAQYILCVRNTGECFGDDCADPCSMNQCRHIENSTGVCTANGESYNCGCKSGFNWSYGRCLLDTTRYIACTGLPENASWNTVFGISQSYDGEKWYPSEIGTYNKTASSTECRFVCNTNYKWDAEEEECQPVSKLTNCSEKKAYSEWNVVSKISQTWNGEAWEPSEISVYNVNPSEDECRFVCKEHYVWDNTNKLCAAEKQQAACTGLPANASWHYETIEQTWNGTSWTPTTNGTHSTGAIENECHFSCNENYEWNSTACAAGTQNVNCEGLPDNAEWNGNTSIKQTWNGSEWFPGNAGSYNTESNPAYCRFRCKDNYNWNGSTCDPATQIANCTGLITNAQWNTVSSIKQTFVNGNWMPTTTATYQEEASDNECHFKCKEHYEWKDGECKAGTKPANACTGLPANAIWVGDTTVEQTWNGTEWTPSTEGHHQSVSNTGCVFTCKTNYNWSNGECKAATRDKECQGLPDQNALWNTASSITQTWNGAEWLPDFNGVYSETVSSTQCRFKCRENYIWNGSACEPRTQIVTCGTLPANAVWNTVSQIKQTWNGTEYAPAVNLIYSETSSETECRYTCKTNYEFKDGACTAMKQTVACQGLPANAQWHTSKIEQTWNGTEWTPSAAGSYSLGAVENQCRFHCIEDGEQYVWSDNTKACVANTKTGQACTGLKDHAHWNQYSAVSQTWNGTEWFPSTTGTYSATADETRCYFSCDENYEWDGTNCVGATLNSDCEGLPANAVWNTVSSITQTYNGFTYTPSTTAEYCDTPSTENCCFKCLANYNVSNDGTLCEAATRLRECTGLPANAEWNTGELSGQITQRWNGTEWAPVLTGTYGTTSNPDKCIFKCLENYEWKGGLCVAKKETALCKGLPANAMWNEVASIVREWQGSAWDLSTKGEYSEEPSKTECRYKCKENFTWDGSKCRANTRIADCLERPAHAVWNETAAITQTWNGREWMPKLEPEYSYSPSDTECKYICDTGYYHVDGKCVANPCNIDGHNPCSDVEHSTGVCETADNIFVPYTCGCETGYNWWGKTGCRRKGIALGNICTGLDRCYDNDTEIVCPSEGEYFYGQDAQYAEKGYCAPRKFTVKETIVGAETHKTVIDKNTKLEWLYDGAGYGSWYEAFDYCDDLNYAGHSDWRLPSIKEMVTLIEYNNQRMIPDEFSGSGWQHGAWSGTDVPEDHEKAFYLNGDGVALLEDYVWDGYAEYHTKATDRRSYICVRGSGLSESSFEEIDAKGDGTEIVIKDTTTNLYWQKTPAIKDWRPGFTYCENLVYGGYDDWRMPNINELYSIIDYTLYDPAVNSLFEISDVFLSYLNIVSSTTAAGYNSVLYGINLKYGYTAGFYKSEGGLLCVRSDLCDEGTFWDGKNCAVSPCVEDSCSMEHSDGICKPKSSSKFECGCVGGYRWNDSSTSCVKDQCLDGSLKNKCASMRGSDGVCTRVGETDFTCGCTEGYFWSISSCRKKSALGSICTGQNQCYDYDGEITCPEEGEDFYGQDAIYAAKGACVPKSYRNATPDGEHPDETVVIDNNTGIMWQRYASEETYTFNNAIGYCADLDYAGYTDWRLPNPLELISILEFGENGPVNTDYFPGVDEYYDEYNGVTTNYRMWGAASYQLSKNQAFNVYLESGFNPLAGYTEKTHKSKVRCVRGNAMKNSLTTWTAENGEEVLVDTESGLMLNPSTTRDAARWGEKLDSCENYSYAGYTDWRMANLYEAFAFADFTPMSISFGTSTRNIFYPSEVFLADSYFIIYRGGADDFVSGLCVRSGNVPTDFQIDGELLNMTCGEIFECINNKCLDGSLECTENCISRSTKNAKYQYQDFNQCYQNHDECNESENSGRCRLAACTAELEACFANSGEGPHCMSNYDLCYSSEEVEINKTCLDLTQCMDSCGEDRNCKMACEFYSTPEAKGDYDAMNYYRDYECAGAADFETCMIAYNTGLYERCYGPVDKTCNELSDCLYQCYVDEDPDQAACQQRCRDNATEVGNTRFDAISQCIEDHNCVYDGENIDDYLECYNTNCFIEINACFLNGTSNSLNCSDLDYCINHCGGDQACEQNCHISTTVEAETLYSDLRRCYDDYQDYCMDEGNPEECLAALCQTEYNTCYNTGGFEPGNDLSCSEINDCMSRCGGNSVCEQKCHNNATPEGETQYLELTDCYDYCSNAGYYYNDCLQDHCVANISTCFGNPQITCHDMMECFVSCGEDQSCIQACYNDTSFLGKNQYNDMMSCYFNNCMEAEDFNGCMSTNCEHDFNICYDGLI